MSDWHAVVQYTVDGTSRMLTHEVMTAVFERCCPA